MSEVVDQLRRDFADADQGEMSTLPTADEVETMIEGDPGGAEDRSSVEDVTPAPEPSSWATVDLSAIEGAEQSPPVLLPRTDDRCLLYEGKLHELAAPPESGKGWLALAAALEPLCAGYAIAYIDFEAGAPELVERLRALGISPEMINEQVAYFAPAEPLTNLNRSDLDAVLARQPALIVIDGVTEALTLHGLDLEKNADVARWLELLPRPAVRSGAAVLLLDHVTKDREARGAYSLGAGHKLAGVDVAYSLSVIEPFGRGRRGAAAVKVRKDRPGHVRAHADGDYVATMRLISDPTDGAVTISLEPPGATEGDFRPTVLMQRLSEAIEQAPGMGKREVRDSVPGKNSAKDRAMRKLVGEQFVRVDASGSAQRHYSERPYREADDPLADGGEDD